MRPGIEPWWLGCQWQSFATRATARSQLFQQKRKEKKNKNYPNLNKLQSSLVPLPPERFMVLRLFIHLSVVFPNCLLHFLIEFVFSFYSST
jgi:hypothetical protein